MGNEPLIKKEEAENVAGSNTSPKFWQKTWFKVVIICLGVLLFFSGVTYAAYRYSKNIQKLLNSTVVSPTAENNAQPAATTSSSASSTPTLQLENYDGGFFNIQKPVGWQVTVGGSCATFSFVIKDPDHPERQIFYFGELGPVYLSENQKKLDQDYVSMGGYTLEWVEMPVVSPLNPENFLKSVSSIAQTNYIKKYMTDVPQLNNVEIISSNAEKAIGQGEAKLMRALFKQDNNLGEGQFYVSTATMLPETGMAAGGIGYAFSFTGLSANKKEFGNLEKKLSESLGTFNISQDYVNNCIAQQNKTYEGIMKAGKTLSETSDIIMSTWENKNRSDDIISEKRSDAMLGRDRVYNPDTGTVYETDNGWYEDAYRPNSAKFDMNNLQKLPDGDYNLWTAPPQSANNIH